MPCGETGSIRIRICPDPDPVGPTAPLSPEKLPNDSLPLVYKGTVIVNGKNILFVFKSFQIKTFKQHGVLADVLSD